VWCVAGSPWRVEVRNPARVTINSSGLHQMSVGNVAIFELHSTDPDSDISVNVTRTYRPPPSPPPITPSDDSHVTTLPNPGGGERNASHTGIRQFTALLVFVWEYPNGPAPER